MYRSLWIWNPQPSLGPPNRGWGLCYWINSHKESGSRLLSRSTAKGPSHQKLMSYLDHAVSSARDCKNTAGPERTEALWVCMCVCVLCVFYRSLLGDWQLRNYKVVKMVIVRMQLFWYCLLRMLDTGRSLFLRSKMSKQKPLFFDSSTSDPVLSVVQTYYNCIPNTRILIFF